MKQFAAVLLFIAMTFLCWGAYGPILHQGQHAMGNSSLRPFVCVGVAYFLIAVLGPFLYIRARGEVGHWTVSGLVWSLIAGVLGAFGSLGIILAFKFRGNPIYVMPLVFGLAPVMNTVVTMAMSRTFKQAGPVFLAGIVLVASGAAGVMYFKPGKTSNANVTIEEVSAGQYKVTRTTHGEDSEKVETWGPATLAAFMTEKDLAEGYKIYLKQQPLSFAELMVVLLAVALTAVSWGSYGPVLHKGQVKMAGSRLRPFMCVGLAYFAIAVVVPMLVLSAWNEPGNWGLQNFGWLTALIAGVITTVGALGIILAFNFGGKPIYVMPLVFGFAPVVNTFITITQQQTYDQVSVLFLVMLLLVIVGAVTVLLFAPKPAKHGGPSSEKSTPEPATV